MNRIHQVIFDRIGGIWRVVSEHVRAYGKTGRRRPGFCGRVTALALVLAAPGLMPDLAHGQVVVDDDEVVMGGGGGTQLSPWHVGGSLWIGGSDSGSLRISNAGVVSALDVELAHGADGALHIETGGVLETGSIRRGQGGQALLNFDGATLKATGDQSDFIQGFDSGELNIGQFGLAMDTDGHNIGISSPFSGTGALSKRGDGTLVLTGANTHAGGTVLEGGTLEIAGTGSLHHPGGSLYVGRNRASTLVVRDEASVEVSDNNLYIGRNLAPGEISTMRILEDGQVFSARASGRSSYLGYGANDTGHAYLSGSGVLWETGRLYVGDEGEGKIEVREGATLRSRGYAQPATADIGSGETARGSVMVSGTGSKWEAGDAFLRIGYGGQGRLDVLDGGRVDSGWTHIGSEAGSLGEVAIEGPGSHWQADEVYVGEYGAGSLSILGGATVASGQAVVGNGDTGQGEALVSGRDSFWEISSHLTIGGEGRGSLTLADEGTVQPALKDVVLGRGDDWNQAAGNAEGVLNIGASADDKPAAAGTLIADRLVFGYGAGTLNFNHTDTDYTFAPQLVSRYNGLHALTHRAGATVLAGDNSGFKGSTTVLGGALTVADKLGGNVQVAGGELVVDGTVAGDVAVVAGGAATGSGRIEGDLDVQGGVLKGTQGRSLVINGNLSLDDEAMVEIALGGAPAPALFDVAGDLALNGTLDVDDLGGFGAGVYRLFDYAGNLTAQGMAIGRTPNGTDSSQMALQTAHAGQVNLINTEGAKFEFWDGGDVSLHDNGRIDGGDGVWRADGRNWTDAHGDWNGAYRPNPTFAVFQGAAGTVTVSDEAGDIAVTGMQFAVDGYRLDGDDIVLQPSGGESAIRVGDGTSAGAAMTATIAAALQGDASLVKTDQGRLVLSATNSYTGGTILKGGVLEISSDANLGAGHSSVRFQGGRLATTADISSARPVFADESAVFDVAQGTALELSGRVTGAGDLIKQGEGVLRLAGVNDYADTHVKAGTLVGSASSLSGDVYNDALLVFEQNTDARFEGHVTGAGDVRKTGQGRLVLGGVSDSDWTVEGGSVETAAERYRGNVEIASGAAFVLDQKQDAVLGGTLSGDGELVKSGTGTLLLRGDSSAFRGTTTVAGGALKVGDASGQGRLGGSLNIEAGGVVGGDGRVGTTRVASGGLLAPGNSIGTLHVDGDLVLEEGARLEIEVDPHGLESDRIEVAGTASVAGGLLHLGTDGNYKPESRYRILNAGAGLTGAFDQVTSRYAFLDPTLSYDYDEYSIDLILRRNDTSFESMARTANQRATAGALETLPQSSVLHQRVLGLADGEAPGVFDALSGELHASVLSALQAVSDDARAVPLAHLRRQLAAGARDDSSDDADPAGGPHKATSPMWVELTGGWRSLDGDGNTADMDHRTHGVFVGAGGDVGGWHLGAALGYVDSRVDVDERDSRADIDTYAATLYAGKAVDMGTGVLNMLAGAGYGRHRLDTKRDVTVGTAAETLRSDYRADSVQLFGELGYAMPLGAAVVEPFAALAHSHVRAHAFDESGGDAALTGRRQRDDMTTSTLGLRARTEGRWGQTRVALQGMLGWRHAFGGMATKRTLAFDGGQPFVVSGAAPSRNAALLDVGLSVAFSRGASLSLEYGAQWGSGSRYHAGRVGVQWKF